MKEIVIGCLLIAALVWSCKKDHNQNPPAGGETDTLTITAFSPVEGPVSTEVTITGKGFSTDKNKNVLTFNGTAAQVLEATSTQLKVSVPEGATTGKLKITVAQKQAFSTSEFVVKTSGGTNEGWLVTTAAGSGTSGSDDGPSGIATFKGPVGLAVDAQGNLYVADAFANKIRRITPQGVVSTYAGTGSRGMQDGNAQTEASFRQPTGVAVDKQGNVYVADYFNHAIRKITPGGIVSTYAGTGVPGSIDGQRLQATFNLPYGLAVDVDDNVYVGDYGNNKVRKIKANGEVVTLAGNGTDSSSDGVGVQVGIPKPGGLTLGNDGTLYVVEKGGGKIRKITAAGQVTTVGGYLSANTEPTGVVVDANNNLYVVYRGLQKIRKIEPGGRETDFAGTGYTGNTDGEPMQASFAFPEGITLWIEPNGKLVFYIGDTDNHVIRRISQP